MLREQTNKPWNERGKLMNRFCYFTLGLLAVCLCLLSGGCSNQIPEKNTETRDATVELTALQYELENQAVDFSDLWFYDQLEEKTGVHVEFEAVRDADWEMRERLMFASGSYKDMILRGSLDTEEYGVNHQMLIPLDEYMDEYMPVYSERMHESGLDGKMLSSDGKMYSIGFLLSQNVSVNGHFFLNRAWMDKLGLETPKTVSELTDVLRAFRDGDPNGNGLQDEIPYEATLDDCNTGMYNAFNFWGIPMNEEFVFADEKGTVSFAPYQNGFRETLEWLHLLVSEKLLDPESLTQGSTLWGTRVNQNTAGFFSYWRLSNTALNKEITDQFECVLPVHADGYSARMSRLIDTVEFGAALTSQNHDIPASLRWLDAQMETETMLVSQNGPAGEYLVREDSGKYKVIKVPEDNELYQMVPVIVGQFFAPDEYYRTIYEPAPHRLEKTGYCDFYEKAGVIEPVSFKELTVNARTTSEESIRIAQLHKKLKTVVDYFIVDSVVNGVTDSSYVTFRNNLKEAGADEYIALYQTVYSRYLEQLGR